MPSAIRFNRLWAVSENVERTIDGRITMEWTGMFKFVGIYEVSNGAK